MTAKGGWTKETLASWGISWPPPKGWRKELERQAVAAPRIAELQAMPYGGYLQTKEWKRKARQAKKRAGYRCQLCPSKGPLEAHHRTYERRGNEWSSDIIVLCADCHGRHHGVLAA